jgi:chromosome segregation ATPase
MIQRYRVDSSGDEWSDDHGDYVRQEDHAAEVAALRAEVETLQSNAAHNDVAIDEMGAAVNGAQERWHALDAENTALRAEVERVAAAHRERQSCLRADLRRSEGRAFDAEAKTATLREILAEIVEISKDDDWYCGGRIIDALESARAALEVQP